MNLYFIIKIIIIFFIFTTNLYSNEKWILDSELSIIEFEVPVLLTKNVKGNFNQIEGLIQINTQNKENNKAIFSVKINSININYKKYNELLLSNVFFDAVKFPIALVDTQKFSYKNNDEINLDVELIIKGVSKKVPLTLSIYHLTEELIQIKGILNFSRTAYNLGTGKWRSTKILKDKATIKVNLFLFKE